MSDEPRSIEVRIYPELHSSPPPSALSDREAWAALDTIWKLLLDSASRVVFAQLREEGLLQEETDEELLLKVSRATGEEVAHEGFTVPPEGAPDYLRVLFGEFVNQTYLAAMRALVDGHTLGGDIA